MLNASEITIPVIDSALRLSHCVWMLTAHQIREELIKQLEDGSLKAVDVARHLNIAPARVSEMKRRDRQVQQEEMEPLANLLNLDEGVSRQMNPVSATSKIINLGRVAQGVWLEETLNVGDESNFVEYDRMTGDPAPTDLFAVTPVGNSMNKIFLPGYDLICRRVPFGDYVPDDGSYVIVQRRNHDLTELTCKQVRVDDDGNYWLHSKSDDPRFQDPIFIGKPDQDCTEDAMEVRIIGKVIRAVLRLE